MIAIFANDTESTRGRGVTLPASRNVSLCDFFSTAQEKCLLLAQFHDDARSAFVKCWNVGGDQIGDRATATQRTNGNQG